ncbi:hypothetical protein V5O48_001489 [Marasmius crinis-equi]|uniref:C2 domain-containing protein n=1 Tax=Marasmius crinis-equi TaxID=585013 RepID=A0ABR3FYS7_9AGAR
MNDSTSKEISSATKIKFTLYEASPLGKYLNIKSVWIAEVSVDGVKKGRAEAVSRRDPNWNWAIEMTVTDSSIVKIHIYHHARLPWVNEELRGDVSIPLKDILAELRISSKPVEQRLELQRPVNNRTYPTSVKVAMQHIHEEAEITQTQSAQGVPEEVATEIINEIGTAVSRLTTSKLLVMREYLELAVRLGESISEIHPFAKLAWIAFTTIPSVFLSQLERDKNVEDLWTSAIEMLDFLKDSRTIVDEQLSPIISAMLKQFYDCSSFIREYCGAGFLHLAGRAIKGSLGDANDTVERFAESFRRLRQRFNERSTLATWKLVSDGQFQLGSLARTIDNIGIYLAFFQHLPFPDVSPFQEQTRLLDNLPGARLPNVRWDLGNTCLPKTRQPLIGEILQWADAVNAPNLFWLHGVAGTGKSTLCNTVAQIFEGLNRLGASFRFSREVAARNDPASLFGNLAYQLARFNVQLKDRILAAIDTYGDMAGLPLSNQLRVLFVEILPSVEFAGPVMIVIDALDEAGDEGAREEFLSALSSEAPRIPKYVRIFITSRDEADIRSRLLPISTSRSIDSVLDTTLDIQVFVEYRMAQIRSRYPGLPDGWPELAARLELASRAHGLFQWAAVACRYIQSFDPEQRLQELLSDTPVQRGRAEETLDQLYLDILRRVCNNIPPPAFRYIVGAILLVRTPLSRPALDSLLGLGNAIVAHTSPHKLSSSESVVVSLGSLLQVEREGGSEELIRILHPSLLDFFLDRGRCTDPRFFIHRSEHQAMLARRCLDVMKALLKRDICEINNPLLPNSSIPTERIYSAIVPSLSYACRYWADHLCEVHGDTETVAAVELFLFDHFLHWLEVMSILNMVKSVGGILRKTRIWFQGTPNNSQILELLDDSLNLIQRFHDPITENAAQIYVSALPFTPPATLLSRTFLSRYHNIPRLLYGIPKTWDAFRNSYGVPPRLLSPISHDGSRFLALGNDGALQLHDSSTTEIRAVFTGQGRVSYARFSDDGKFVLAAGSDAMIRVWDAETGLAVGRPCGPFEVGYGWSVRPGSIVISPDGSRVAATFAMDLLQVWNVASGATLASYYSKRSDAIPQFSPDGSILLAGWKDSVFIIDMITDTLRQVLPLPSEDTDTLFSPDATKVICYAHPERKVYLLCARTGNVIFTLDEAIGISSRHKPVSVFSPDSSYLLTMKEGGVLTLWDISKDMPVSTTFSLQDVDNITWSTGGRLAFTTPGSLHIVVITEGSPSLSSLATRKVAALSWQEERIVALSDDKSVWLWDGCSGARTLGFIAGEKEPSFVAISPNLEFLFAYAYPKTDIWEIRGLSQHPSEYPWLVDLPYSFKKYHPHVAFDPNAKQLATGARDGTITLKNPSGMQILRQHTKKITALTFSSDGSFLVSSSADSTVHIWDSENLTSLRLAKLEAPVKGIALDMADQNIVTVSKDKSIHLRSIAAGAGEEQSPAPFAYVPLRLAALAITEDKKSIVGASKDGRVYSIDAETRIVQGPHLGKSNTSWLNGNPCFWASLLPNGVVRTLSSRTQTQLWEPSTTSPITAERNLPVPPRSTIISASFSPDGRRIFYAYERYSLVVHAAGATRSIGEHCDEIGFMQFTFDGSRLATIYRSGRICIWDTVSGMLLTEASEAFPGHLAFSFSPDAKKAAVATSRRVCILSAQSGQTLWSAQIHNYDAVYFSRDGSSVVCMDRYKIWCSLYRTDSGELLTGQYAGKTTSTAPDTLQHIVPPDIERQTAEKEFFLYQPLPYSSPDRKVTSHDDSLTATTTTTLEFSIIESGTLDTLSTLSHDGSKISVSSPTFSADGSLVGIICRCSIITWDVTTGERLGIATVIGQPVGTTFNMYAKQDWATPYEPHPPSISSFAFVGTGSPMVAAITSQYSPASEDTKGGEKITLYLWDRAGGMLKQDAMGTVRLWDPVFLPNGNRILMHNGSRYREVQIWDTLQCTKTKSLELAEQSHQHFTSSNVAFSSDEKRFAHLGQGGKVSVYDLETGALLHHNLRHYYHDSITSLSFAPQSHTRIILLSCDRTFVIWDLQNPPSPNNPIMNFPSHMQAVHKFRESPWFEGTGGQKLFWLPGGERGCLLATSTGHVLFGPSGTDDEGPLVVDLQEYLQIPAVKAAWRAGGVRFSRTMYYQQVSCDAVVSRVLADRYYRSLVVDKAKPLV